jgi:hypothetical protein
VPRSPPNYLNTHSVTGLESNSPPMRVVPCQVQHSIDYKVCTIHHTNISLPMASDGGRHKQFKGGFFTAPTEKTTGLVSCQARAAANAPRLCACFGPRGRARFRGPSPAAFGALGVNSCGPVGAPFIKSDELRSRPAAFFYVLLYAKSTIPNARHDSQVIF